MAARKEKPRPPEKGQQQSRFTLADIERAVEGVERAGLVVRSVEITARGSIKIETVRDTKASTSASEEAAERQEQEAQPIKKRVQIMDPGIRGVLIALIIVIIIFALGVGGQL